METRSHYEEFTTLVQHAQNQEEIIYFLEQPGTIFEMIEENLYKIEKLQLFLDLYLKEDFARNLMHIFFLTDAIKYMDAETSLTIFSQLARSNLIGIYIALVNSKLNQLRDVEGADSEGCIGLESLRESLVHKKERLETYATSVEAWEALYDDPEFGSSQKRQQFLEMTQSNQSLGRLYGACEALKQAILSEESNEIKFISRDLDYTGCSAFEVKVIRALIDRAKQQLEAVQGMDTAASSEDRSKQSVLLQSLTELYELGDQFIKDAELIDAASFNTLQSEDRTQYIEDQECEHQNAYEKLAIYLQLDPTEWIMQQIIALLQDKRDCKELIQHPRFLQDAEMFISILPTLGIDDNEVQKLKIFYAYKSALEASNHETIALILENPDIDPLCLQIGRELLAEMFTSKRKEREEDREKDREKEKEKEKEKEIVPEKGEEKIKKDEDEKKDDGSLPPKKRRKIMILPPLSRPNSPERLFTLRKKKDDPSPPNSPREKIQPQ